MAYLYIFISSIFFKSSYIKKINGFTFFRSSREENDPSRKENDLTKEENDPRKEENDLSRKENDLSREENDPSWKEICILTHKNYVLRKQLAFERVEAIQEKADFTKRIFELEKYQKEKANILDFLEREVTCPVCLMIPRTKKIPICWNGHTTCLTCRRYNFWSYFLRFPGGALNVLLS